MGDDEDLFADSDDDAGSDNTDDLIAASAKKPSSAAAPKKRLQKKKDTAATTSKKRKPNPIPDADGDDDDDDNNNGGGGRGLFDDSDDEQQQQQQDKPAAKQPAAAAAKTMTKRERMEALQARKRQESGVASKSSSSKPKDPSAKKKPPKEDGAPSDGEDSYDSADFVRTKEDNDFIDVDDDDPDALNELYAEQHFEDERPDDEDGKKKKKGGGGGGGGRKSRSGDEQGERRGGGGGADEDLDNPIMAAVHKMKKKKREQRKFGELEEEAKEFIHRMERAAEDDLQAIKERRPAVAKLNMLPQVVDTLAKRDMIRILLDHDVLSVCKTWIQPLSNGALGNLTVRQELIQAIRKVQEISTDDLKRSDIGKVIMTLFNHPMETPALKREMKALIEQWSRPIFQKSGNMKDLEHVQQSRPRPQYATAASSMSRFDTSSSSANTREADVHAMIASGSRGASADHGNRVRIPYSKGFQYTVRPMAKGMASEPPPKGASKEGVRNNLVKRILEKGRPVVKNHRSANVSIEGRPTK